MPRISPASTRRQSQASFSDMPPPKKGIFQSAKKAASSVAKYVKKSAPAQFAKTGYKLGRDSRAVSYFPGKVGGVVGKAVARVKGRVTHKKVDIAKTKEKGKRIASKPFKVASGLVGAAVGATLGTAAVGVIRGYGATKYAYAGRDKIYYTGETTAVGAARGYDETSKLHAELDSITQKAITNIDRGITSSKALLKGEKSLTKEMRQDIEDGVYCFLGFKGPELSVESGEERMSDVHDLLKRYGISVNEEFDQHGQATALVELLTTGQSEEAAQDLLNLMAEYRDTLLNPKAPQYNKKTES